MKVIALMIATALVTAEVTLRFTPPQPERVACPLYFEAQQLADATYHINGTTVCRYNVPSTFTRRLLLQPNPPKGSQR